MLYYQLALMSASIFIAAIIGVVRFNKIDPVYYPVISCFWVASVNEIISFGLIENGFTRGRVDKTLFLRMHKVSTLLVQIYVDDIIFGSTDENLCKRFAKMMTKKFEMSMMGEITFFLGLQVKQISQHHQSDWRTQGCSAGWKNFDFRHR